MSVQKVELVELEKKSKTGPGFFDGNIDIIKNVKVKLSVKIGEAEIPVSELMSLTKNSIVKLTCKVNAPADIILDERVVARGNLVVADDNFGVQVTEILV